MALGGGTFTTFNKRLPGYYYRNITVGQVYNEADSGIVAGGIVADWGPDGEIFEISADDFLSDPVAVTGYSYSDPKNQTLREVFKHAVTLITYRLNSGGKAAKVSNVAQAKYTGSIGNKITVSVLKNIVDDSKYDVTTYFDGVEKDKQTVPETGRDEIAITKGTEKPGTAVETADATFTFDKNKITVQFSNVPEGYKPSVRIKGQVGILAFTPGRMEDMELQNGNKHIITYSPGAAINGEMTIEAVLTKDKVTVIKSHTYTCQLNENVETGADGSKLLSNDFVEFEPVMIAPNAGYVLSGGSSATNVTAANHSNFLSKLEGHSYNNLYYDGTTEEIKELYYEFDKRLRDTRGILFQTVMENYAADYEGVVDIYNTVINPQQTQTLAPWLAGYMSALPLYLEATNKVYDGELSIFTDLSQSRLEALLDQGKFVFHNVSLDEVRTLEDINSFLSFTEEKNSQLSQNKDVRIIDYIHNHLAAVINANDIGTLNNTDDGRNALWLRVDTLLSNLRDIGAIDAYEPTDIVVRPIATDPNAVEIILNISINGTIRRVYVTAYLSRNQ